MLNQLKNNELFSFFEKQLNANQGSTLHWVDLWSLSRALHQKEIASDLELETILYGSAASPHYSGFTEKRIQSWIDAFGEGKLEIVSENREKKTARVHGLKLDTDKMNAKRQKLEQVRFREKRKRFRKKFREWGCRLREPVNFSKLPRGLKLNLGAGDEDYEGFVKVDWAGPQHVFDDIVTLQKIPNESVSEIYSNHVLEHIPPHLLEVMLKRWREVLIPGGRLMLRVPDAKQATASIGGKWNEVNDTDLRSFGFPDYLARESEREGTVSEEMAIQFIYGWSDVMPGFWDMSNQHKSLWTPALARMRLEQSGFEVRTAQNFGTLQTIVVAVKR